MKKGISIMALVAVMVVQVLPFAVPHAQAAVSDWERSFSMIPSSSEDFASATFQESLRNMKAVGANYVTLIIPYYQSNSGSTDIQRGWNTPSDASLISAIQYAHSIGLKVSIAVYLENFSGEWRAYINPGDRDSWYRNYGNVLTYYAHIAQQYGVERFVLGAELVSMASAASNGDNTQRWNTMISNVRAVYGGALTYSANRAQEGWGSEAPNIGFWNNLDAIGLSVYYSLWGDGSVASMEQGWQNVNDAYITPMHNQYPNKPIIFTEVGYRSVREARNNPWDSGSWGEYDAQEQVNAYTALFSYWNRYPFLKGVDMWWWKTNPNAGGSGDIDYTPQNKPAEQTLTQWWVNNAGGTTPPPQGSATVTTSGSTNPTSVAAGQSVTVNAQVTSQGSLEGALIDLEVYNGGTRVFQKFIEGQNFTQGQSRSYSGSFTPNTAGIYTLKIGVFNSNWSTNYAWNDNAATITVGAGGGGGTTNTTAGALEIWWPTDGSRVTGVQPFKAMVQNLDLSQYTMYWSVDGGGRVQMGNSNEDYPHKEAWVDLSGWRWQGPNPYTLTFTATNSSGSTILEKSVKINTP